MSQGLVERQYLEDIGDAIRGKVGGSSTYTPSQMASAIAGIHTADEVVLVQKTVNANGQYNPSDDSADGYSGVMVNIPNTYSSGDEGKVVSDGALISQSEMSVVSNGTYNTTLFSQVNVAIHEAVLMSKVISENGTYDAADDNVDGFSRVTVNVAGGGGGGLPTLIIDGTSGDVVDDNITNIRAYALTLHSKITGVQFDNAVTIGSYAFSNCSELGYAFFDKCTRIETSAFYACSKLTHISFPKCTYIGLYAFNSCSRLTSAIFPECISIMNIAFSTCFMLHDISFPECTNIYNHAFRRCSSLTSAIFPKCVSLGGCVFESCVNLETAIFPMCKYLSEMAFQNCSKLSIISFPECSGIDRYVFAGTSLSNVTMPKCEFVGGNAFDNCGKLQTVMLNSCSRIGTSAFYRCISLESVYILTSSVCSMTGSAFTSTPMVNSSYLGFYGSIFVPLDLVDAYKSASYWSAISDRITAYIEE